MKSAFSVAAAAAATTAAAHGAPVPLIVDTDMGGGGCNDVDDVVALSISNALADAGEVDLLAVVLDTAPYHSAGVISVINHYYGRDLDAVPIGAYNVSTPGATLEMQDPLPYVDQLVGEFESPIKNSTEAEDAVLVYRRALAAAADHSVAVSSIGIHSNLAALLKSEPDAFSPLSGRDLVARKVKVLAVMGGVYPASNGHPECNVCGGGSNEHNHLVASAASSYVAANWPPESKLIWSGAEVGSQVQTGGAGFQDRCPDVATTANPCHEAMINYEHGPDKSRYSWDPLTTLAVVRGAEAVGTVECSNCDGKNVIDPNTGNNLWQAGPKTNQTYLVLTNATFASDAINELLCHPPKHAAKYTRW